MSTAPHPIVTCGNNQADATKVHNGMQPEFEGDFDPVIDACVLYAGFNLPATRLELPYLLLGSSDIPTDKLHTQIGSNDLKTRPPIAIVIGGGYDDESLAKLDGAIAEASQQAGIPKPKVPYFRADNGLTDLLIAQGKGPHKGTPEYGAAITKRLKQKLEEVLGSGLSGGEGQSWRTPVMY